MVDFSLRRARNNWNKLSSPGKIKQESVTKLKANAYEDFIAADESLKLPEIDLNDRKKVGTSMQRRLSFHNVKHVSPTIDYNSFPSFPTNIPLRDNVLVGGEEMQTNQRRTSSDIYEGRSLREILKSCKFQAKRFVHDKLGGATALEIDKFASNLHDLSIQIEHELRENINTSYKEITIVNRELDTATGQLKQLRSKIQQLQAVMKQFTAMAEKRLQLERDHSRNSSGSVSISRSNTCSLLPPLRSCTSRKDKTSIYLLEQIWANDLTELFKEVEGAQKYITPIQGRHILHRSNDWEEINIINSKPLHSVRIYLLNDSILVAIGPQANKSDLVAKQYCSLRELIVTEEPFYTLSFRFGNKHHSLYRTKNANEYEKLVENIKSAKDDLRDIYQAEEDNVWRLRNSLTQIQSIHLTPSMDNAISPVREHVRQRSIGTTQSNSGRTQVYQDNFLQNGSVSVHTTSGSGEKNQINTQLRMLENKLEELSVPITRMDFVCSASKLLSIEKTLGSIFPEPNEEVLLDLIKLKCSQNRTLITEKLKQTINSEFNDIEMLNSSTKALISLGLPVDALTLYLSNRSNFIQNLILQVAFNVNSNSYITQVAVIRFQIIKKVATKFQELYEGKTAEYASVLVTWCNSEIDKHFSLIQQQLVSDDQLSPQAIKISRKQIDELKHVGMDFIYKLNEFLKIYNNKIL